MTKQEFWAHLDKLLLTKEKENLSIVPHLINQAREEHLSILVIGNNNPDGTPGELSTVFGQNKSFLQCTTTWFPAPGGVSFPLQRGQTVVETDLDDLYEDLIDCGYDGLAFIVTGTMIGYEWKDFFQGQKKKKQKRK